MASHPTDIWSALQPPATYGLPMLVAALLLTAGGVVRYVRRQRRPAQAGLQLQSHD